MQKAILACVVAGMTWLPAAHGRDHQPQAVTPIALHAENPHYFHWRGRPTILITSAEHYGAVMNLDFDYRRYLDTLAADGLNYTRIFSGAYVEPPAPSRSTRNTLAPPAGRFIAPWARSNDRGYANGGNKFDLARWDDDYFRRLKDFVADASARGIVVELSLFCPMYEEMQWKLSPMNAANNVNGVGKSARTDVYTLDRNGALQAVQEALTRKLVTELNAFDNLFFEICNEPYFGGVTMAWQHRIADVIVETERALPARHLIAQNIANGSAQIDEPAPGGVDLQLPLRHAADAVGDELRPRQGHRRRRDRVPGHRRRALSDGRLGVHPRRRRAVQQPRLLVRRRPGRRHVRVSPDAARRRQPGLSSQMKMLAISSTASTSSRCGRTSRLLKGGVPIGTRVQALVEPGRAMAVYLRRPVSRVAEAPAPPSAAELMIDVPEGEWLATWVDPVSGKAMQAPSIRGGGIRTLSSPPFEIDIALRIIRK